MSPRTPRPRRRQTCDPQCIYDIAVRPIVCRVCGHERDESRAVLGHKARADGIAAEEWAAKQLGWLHVGDVGGTLDLQSPDAYWIGQVKHGGYYAPRLMKQLDKLGRFAGMPMLVVADKAPDDGDPPEAYVVMKLTDFTHLFGQGDDEEQAA